MPVEIHQRGKNILDAHVSKVHTSDLGLQNDHVHLAFLAVEGGSGSEAEWLKKIFHGGLASFKLLHWVVVVLVLVALATLIAIMHAQLWHYHLLRFTGHVWTSFLLHIGSTGPGFISPIVVSLLSVIFTIICIRFLQGTDAMKKHFWENAAITAVVFVTVMLVVYGTQFAWEVANVGYEDHMGLRQRIAELSTPPIDPTMPYLVGEIIQTAPGNMDIGDNERVLNYRGKVHKRMLAVIIWASIKNKGADSIAEKYHLVVTLNNGQKVIGQPANLPQNVDFADLRLTYPNINRSSLVEKTIEKPITKSTPAVGVLIFFMDGNSHTPEELAELGVLYDISLQDVNGREYHITHTINKGDHSGPSYIPGTSPITGDNKK